MSVLVNFKICDNAKECGGIAVCPTGALSWDEEKGTIHIDNSKCISCGLCEKECPIGAIRVAKDQEEYEKIEKEIIEDERTTKDLFVDRYGAALISDFFSIDMKDIPEKVKNDGITLVELYDPDTVECLLKSIPIKEISMGLPKDTMYYKVIGDDSISEYGVEELPALLVFKSGNLLGHIDGYHTVDEIDTVLSYLDEILKGE